MKEAHPTRGIRNGSAWSLHTQSRFFTITVIPFSHPTRYPTLRACAVNLSPVAKTEATRPSVPQRPYGNPGSCAASKARKAASFYAKSASLLEEMLDSGGGS
jgi:hypothetical protein